MYLIIWEYRVKAEHSAEFETIYAPSGAWAQLFKKGKGYLGTELLHDVHQPERYITIDRWVSLDAYNSWRAKWQDEYNALDERCKHLVEHEWPFGTLSPVRPGG